MADVPAAVQVQFTVDDPGRGAAIAEALLRERLAACVQRVGPIRSRYWWQGDLEEAEEWLYLCKARADGVTALTARLVELHPYDTPEVIAVPVVGGHDRYLGWVASEADGPPG